MRLDVKDLLFLNDVEFFVSNPDKMKDYDHRPAQSIREFIESPYYLNAGGDCWESVKRELEEFHASGKRQALFEMSIGSGKSFLSSVEICFWVHRLLCFKEPQRQYKLSKGSKIAFMNMSNTAKQAKDVVFGEIKARIDNSPWFQRFAPHNPKVKSELQFPKDIYIIPGNSTASFQLGYNVFGAVLDEADFYPSADEIHGNISRRIESRFGAEGILIAITSPSYTDGFAERKQREAPTNPNLYAVRRALWEMKPGYGAARFYFNVATMEISTEPKEGENWHPVPIELIAQFRNAPEKAMRDLMARPSQTIEPYFRDRERFLASFNAEKEPADSEDVVLDRRHLYYGHVDLGISHDAAGFCLGHEEHGVIYLDLLGRIQAPQGGEVDLEFIRDLYITLRKRGFKIAGVSYDGYQSADSIQRLSEARIQAEVRSVDRTTKAYDTLKDRIYGGTIKLPKVNVEAVEASGPKSASEYLYWELRRVELLKGIKVDHPPKGSKDVSDAVAGMCSWFAEPDRPRKPSPILVKRNVGFGSVRGIGGSYERSQY